MTGTNLARVHHIEDELDSLFDRAIDLWDATPGSTEEAELVEVMDLIEKYDRELYPDYWALRDKETEMVFDFSSYVDPGIYVDEDPTEDLSPAGSLENLREFIVEEGAQWKNEATLTITLEGLIPLASDHKLITDCTDAELADHGYLGLYAFAVDGVDGVTEKRFHVRCPAIRDIP